MWQMSEGGLVTYIQTDRELVCSPDDGHGKPKSVVVLNRDACPVGTQYARVKGRRGTVGHNELLHNTSHGNDPQKGGLA